MAIDNKLLEDERDTLKASLREIDAEQRKLEGQQKALRQREMRAKRKIEALDTLIEVADAPKGDSDS